MTLQEQLQLWQNNETANDEIDLLIEKLNDGVINPEVNPTVKTPALELVLRIENNRNTYIADKITDIENAIEKSEIEEYEN